MKTENFPRLLNLRISEQDFQLLQRIRTEAKIPISELVRSSIQFYAASYLANPATTNEK